MTPMRHVPPMAEGFAAHPYAPRSTLDTLRKTSFTRHLIVPEAQPSACVHCGRTIYRINEEPEHLDTEGRTIGASFSAIDADPDVAGVAPEPPSTWGSGIDHTLLCGIPRPLPERTPEQMATSTANFRTPSPKPRITSRKP